MGHPDGGETAEKKCVSFLKGMRLPGVVKIRKVLPCAGGFDWCMGHPDGGDATVEKAV